MDWNRWTAPLPLLLCNDASTIAYHRMVGNSTNSNTRCCEGRMGLLHSEGQRQATGPSRLHLRWSRNSPRIHHDALVADNDNVKQLKTICGIFI